jgi:hypothetical protein
VSKKFLIVGNIRCGATWLQAMLNTLREVRCDDELRWASSVASLSYQICIDDGEFNLSKYLEKETGEAEIVGSKLLMDPRKYFDGELKLFSEAMESGMNIIHIQRPYEEILKSIIQNQGYSVSARPGEEISNVLKGIAETLAIHKNLEKKLSSRECEEIISALFANDRFLSGLQKDKQRYFQVDYSEISKKFADIVKFIGLGYSPPPFYFLQMKCGLNKLPSKEVPNILRYSKTRKLLQSYEEMRLLLKNMNYLSEVACAGLLRTHNDKTEVPVYDAPLLESHGPIIVFVDTSPSIKYLEGFIEQQEKEKYPLNILVIFSFMAVVKGILLDDRFCRFIEKGTLKLWYSLEWEENLEGEISNLRSPLHSCNTVIAQGGHPFADKVRTTIYQTRVAYLNELEESRRGIEAYYQSAEFQSRLDAIQKGTKPKIYLERTCVSVSVKRFTDYCAGCFKEMGCEVYVHEPCSYGMVDYMYATELELSREKPDLFVRSPNFTKGFRAINSSSQVPTLYSIQDVGPHFDAAHNLAQEPLNKHDLLYFLLPGFKEAYLVSGVPELQMICDYLPTRMPKKEISVPSEDEMFDIGYVKTMGASLSLTEIIVCKDEKDISEVKELEELILQRVRSAKGTLRSEVMSWGRDREEQEKLLSYYHRQLSAYFIKLLNREKYSLGLTGKNWDKIPSLKKYSLGHSENREEYHQRFLRNKINLSINPWSEHHLRILEGGSCGAFFLVYKVADEVVDSRMAEELVSGEHFDYFSSSEELLEKSRYYLARPDLRSKIGNNLRELVKKRFSYKRLCSEFLNRFKTLIEKGSYCES